MSRVSLRPEAERTLCWAATRGVQGHIRMLQERHIVASHIQIAFVHVNYMWQSVEILDGRTVQIMNHFSIWATVACAEYFGQRFTIGVFNNSVVELATYDEVDLRMA